VLMETIKNLEAQSLYVMYSKTENHYVLFIFSRMKLTVKGYRLNSGAMHPSSSNERLGKRRISTNRRRQPARCGVRYVTGLQVCQPSTNCLCSAIKYKISKNEHLVCMRGSSYYLLFQLHDSITI
jgi:hypothetical protein